MERSVVITGVGLVTPLGHEAPAVLDAISAGRSALTPVEHFDATPFACRSCAVVDGFDAEAQFGSNKTLRLMNRDAQLAAVAARRAVQDAGLDIGGDIPAGEVGLFGSTGLAGLDISEVSRLVRNSADEQGQLDLQRFGHVALKHVRPVLSFKILANMPICFVSILEGIRGPNAVYTPWEGQGARAIVAGIRAVRLGRVRCALVGGCDAKAHSLGFLSLQQQGVFLSSRADGAGTVPGEGAAFLVLEDTAHAAARGAGVYARVAGWRTRTRNAQGPERAFAETLGRSHSAPPAAVLAGADGGTADREAESRALDAAGAGSAAVGRPKDHLGNLFAAAAAVQVALAAASCRASGGDVAWANCFGHGSEIASFVLEGL